MYSRIAKAKQRKIRNIIVSVLGATLSLAMIIFLIPKIELFSDTFTTHAEAEVVKSTSTSLSSTLNETSISTISSESSSVEVSEVSEEPAIEEVYTESEEPVGEEATVTESAVYMTDSEVADTTTSNGNTAGTVGTAAAAQMAAATGIPQSTWEAIIARESNGDPNVTNASGASGLFQTMPGWGSTATVQDQITAAINAYKAQGLSAWGY